MKFASKSSFTVFSAASDFIRRLLPTSLSYNANTRFDYQLVTSDPWVDSWHVSCTPGKQVSVLA